MAARAFDAFHTLLKKWVWHPGDSEETILLKKVWWIFVTSCILFPGIEVVTASAAGEFQVALLSLALSLFYLTLLVAFHVHKRNIEGYGLAFQLSIVLVTSVKALLTGGLIYTAGVVYVGLIGPIQAIIFPNRQRAVWVFLFYVVATIAGTFAQHLFPGHGHPGAYFTATYVSKFIFGTSFVFFSLYYFTGQLKKMKAEEAIRLRALNDLRTRFCSDIAHEFRTPLSIILGMTEQVRREPSRFLSEGTKLIRENGRRLMTLSSQILDLSKLDAKALPVTLVQDDIVAYVRNVASSFHTLTEKKKIALLVSAVPARIEMDFDTDKLHSILSNLLSNAIKFTPESGEVNVRLSQEGHNPKQWLFLTVTDTGLGIPAQLTDRVFDRYFQVNNPATPATPAARGTGLGLALTKELVHLLGGSITVQSTEGKGSVFVVRLPITRLAPNGHISTNHFEHTWGETELTFPESQPVAVPRTKKLNLLIVDDNPDFVAYLKSLLEEDYRMDIAWDGEEGWSHALQHVPDLIVSDVTMPKLDGISMCEKLKQDLRTSHIPIILLTARADKMSKLDGLVKGADAYLTKPFDREELMATIRNQIAMRKMLQGRFKSDADAPSVPESAHEAAFLHTVTEVMEKHLHDEDFGISELCRALGMSRTQLYRKYHALTDTTAHRHFLELRLNRAKALLQNSDMSVTEIGLEVGFKNLSHFSRTFKQVYGMAPSELQ